MLLMLKNNTLGIIVLTFFSNFTKTKGRCYNIILDFKTLWHSLKKKGKEKKFLKFFAKIKGGGKQKTSKNLTFLPRQKFLADFEVAQLQNRPE